MFKNILVPIDGSDHASKATNIASDLAAKYDARIVFVHALLSNTKAAGIRDLIDTKKLPESADKELDRIENLKTMMASNAVPQRFVDFVVSNEALVSVGDILLGEAERTAKEHGVKNITRTWKLGDPADCILAAADDEKAVLIVMGSRGLSNLSGLFVGSVSHKVSHLSHCTYISVK